MTPARSILFLIAFVTTIHGEDWPQWRGQNRNAVSSETGLMKTWSAKEPPAKFWTIGNIGEGYSSVVVSRGVVYTTGRIQGDVFCYAIDLKTGTKKWERKIGETSRNVMSTPSVSDELVYALDPDGELVCLRVGDGKLVWQRSMVEDFSGRLMSGRGYGESPLIDGDHLVCTPGGKEAMIVKLDRRTGEVIWKASIPEFGDSGSDGAGFSSISISNAAGVRQYVQLVGRGLIGIDAKTGKFLWGYNDISNRTANIPTPVVRDDFVFSANGYHAGAVLLKIERANSGLVANEIYRLKGNRFQNHHGGFVLIGDHVFGGHGSNNGLPTCLEFETGKIAWKQRGPGTGSASVVAADGHLYFRYQNGLVALIEANADEYRLKGTFEIPTAGGDSWSHPVIADGKLFLREQASLTTFDIRAKTTTKKTHPDIPLGFQNLSRLGATVQLVDPTDDLFRFAIPSGMQSIPLVKLTNRHMDPNGTLKPAVLKELDKQNSGFAINVTGTRISGVGLRQIAAQKHLVGLNVAVCSQLDDAAFESLAQADDLQVLICAGTTIGSVGLTHLAKLPNLVALDLDGCDHVTNEACKAISRMNGLRALVLKKTGFESNRIGKDGLEQLANLKELEYLDLYGNAIDSDAAKQLAQFEELRDLNLSLNPIHDADLKSLAKLTRLTRLTLLYSEGFAGPQISDAGVVSLSKLSHLERLNLTGAKITDESIAQLSRLKKLKHLDLVRSKLTASGLSRLNQALPKCQIVVDMK